MIGLDREAKNSNEEVLNYNRRMQSSSKEMPTSEDFREKCKGYRLVYMKFCIPFQSDHCLAY